MFLVDDIFGGLEVSGFSETDLLSISLVRLYNIIY